MKKSVMLMVGILAVSLAGSAQAATMFAVQDAGGTDKATISDAGDIAGNKVTLSGNIEGGLSKAPVVAGFPPMAAGAGVFHVASDGNTSGASAFLAQHTGFPQTPGGSTFFNATAPNFSFYRINKKDDGTYVLPDTGQQIGYFNFGSIDTTKDPNSPVSRKNIAIFGVKAESTWSSLTNTPTFFSWANTTVGGAFVEKMRLSSAGSLGIGTTVPTSKLQVVGLPVFADNTTALAGGLTAGAFYRTATGVLMVAF